MTVPHFWTQRLLTTVPHFRNLLLLTTVSYFEATEELLLTTVPDFGALLWHGMQEICNSFTLWNCFWHGTIEKCETFAKSKHQGTKSGGNV